MGVFISHLYTLCTHLRPHSGLYSWLAGPTPIQRTEEAGECSGGPTGLVEGHLRPEEVQESCEDHHSGPIVVERIQAEEIVSC